MSEMFDKTDVAWQAFRYIAHEMDADELAAFEQLLAADQRLREEVARAVELTQAMAAIPHEVAPARPAPRWSHRLSWMLAGTAACLLVVGAIDLMKSTDAPPTIHSTELNHTLAAAWVGSQQVTDEIASLPAEMPESAVPEEEIDETDDMAVPEWLLAAVSSEQAPPPADQP